MSYFIEDLIAVSSGAMATCAAGPWTDCDDRLPDGPSPCIVEKAGGNCCVAYWDGSCESWRDHSSGAVLKVVVCRWAEVQP